MKRIDLFAALALGLALALTVPLAAASPMAQATPFHPLAHPARQRPPRNSLAAAQRALLNAKMFLAKAPSDPAGHSEKAANDVNAALAELAALAQKP